MRVKQGPPELEVLTGVSQYKSCGVGFGGKIKQQPADFVVEEVSFDGSVLTVGLDIPGPTEPSDYTVFTLEKTNWDTMRAVKELSNRVHESRKRFSFAGTKDKKAVSTQRVSAYKVPIERLQNISVRDMRLHSFGYSDKPVELGGLSANRFTVTVRGIGLGDGEVRDRVNSIAGELSDGFPNYYGLQRFGIRRPITHVVGRKIVAGDIEGAVMTYLCDVYEGEEDESLNARKKLRDTGDFRGALKYFPKHLGYEVSLINHLVERPGDFAGAVRRLPKGLKLMFVHAYQSFIFNKALSAYLSEEKNVERLPLVGFETKPDSVTEKILAEEGISPADFKLKSIPELSSRGVLRECFEFTEGFSVIGVGIDELNDGKTSVKLGFTLQPGVYATVLLREFMKNKWWG